MYNYIVLSEKEWHISVFNSLKMHFKQDNWFLLTSKNDFKLEKLKIINPKKIFIPHWSYIIPKEIYENYDCIVFHMTDLPYGRGGSPLQNLILNGHHETKISAIKVEDGIDTGGVYLKKPLGLDGSAFEIFSNASLIIQDMIKEILINNLNPIVQSGKITNFKRRKPEESNIFYLDDINIVYDFIRMLDCDGYPHAFIETDFLKIEFTNAEYNSENNLTANVRISKK